MTIATRLEAAEVINNEAKAYQRAVEHWHYASNLEGIPDLESFGIDPAWVQGLIELAEEALIVAERRMKDRMKEIIRFTMED